MRSEKPRHDGTKPIPERAIAQVRTVFRFPVLGRLWKYVLAVAIYSALVVEIGMGEFHPQHVPAPTRAGEMVIAGILFGWLMSFRTQTAYARWWDGRGLWGQLVNDSRNLILKARTYVADEEQQAKLAAAVTNFAAGLRDHLRLPKGSPGPHGPMAAAAEVFRIIRGWHTEGYIDGYAFLTLDQHAQQLMNVCGACEKIRATPLTASYRGLLRKGITAYLLFLPWVMNDEIGWATVPVCVLASYAVVGLELIATSIEDPFGYDGDDLPLDDIVAVIRRAATK